MTPLLLTGRWTSTSESLRLRVARKVDRIETVRRIENLLRAHADPIAYEVFDRSFMLCEPQLPGVVGDPHIALVIGDAEHGLFFVGQRERGGLSGLSVHESVHDAARDFMTRAMGAAGLAHLTELIAYES